VVVAVKQDAQLVEHPVVATVATHAVVPVYPAAQVAHVRTVPVIVHDAQPTTKPVAAVVAGEDAPVVQLIQAVPERTYPALQAVQVATAALHNKQFVSVHAVATQRLDVKTYPGLHVAQVVSPTAGVVAR